MRIMGKIALLIVAALVGVGIFAGGFVAAGLVDDEGPRVLAGVTPSPELGKTVENKLEVFWEAWEYVQDHFYQGPVDPGKLIEGATRGMVRASGDPYTDWVDAEHAKVDRNRLEGQFEGIGANVQLSEDGFLRIERPLPGSPAEQAGLKPKDIVLAVDGVSTKGKTLEELVVIVRGPKGTPVVLTVRSEGETGSHDVRIIRGEVRVPSVVAKMTDEFGYVRLSNFGTHTTEELIESLRNLREAGAKGIVLDLRNNPGGLLDAAVNVAGQFLPKDTVVLTEKSRSEGDVVFKAPAGGQALDLPLVILTNAGSASASEIVAGAIKDHARGKLVGKTTFGKGSVQVPFELRDKSVVRVTVAIWQTPSGTHLVGAGIEPDFILEADAQEPGAVDDPYLEVAKRILRGQPCCEGLARAA